MAGLALVGAGKWGGNWLRTLAGMPEVTLRWCCDLNETLLAKVAQNFPRVPTTTSFDDLLRDPATEGIVLASIAPTHFPLAKKALEAGKHVLVEKPMTLTTTDAVELNRIADWAGRTLMVGHLMEYHPALPAIRHLIQSGELGEIRRIESRRTNHGTLRTDENVWWSFAPHDISMAVRLMDDWPIAVRCEGQCIVQPRIADVVGGTLRFPGNRVARIDVSWHDTAKVRELKIYGTRKWVVFDDALPADRKVLLHDRGFDVNSIAAPMQRITMRQGGVESLVLSQTEPLVAEARHFVECIRTGARPISDGLSGAAVVSVLEFGQRSMELGREIAIPNPSLESTRRQAA
ncbi:MAG TPA: Gfo/Idh/MocA family oxidoreductase [Gemmataceae bacterium]|jgi:predicted dehydrogenase|nr:Gfo/Idh/MocA family oxidoreductase [Gemmataceae bacterium]